MMANNYYKAAEGRTYKRIIDGFIMGPELRLRDFIDGTPDVIENYVEVDIIPGNDIDEIINEINLHLDNGYENTFKY